MSDELDTVQIKEVYSRFGLAFYEAQVFEHGIVNALLILDHVPNRRHLASSQEEWAESVDTFTDQHFDTTMGRMLNALESVISVPRELRALLQGAQKLRNWLAHDYFRERAQELLNPNGRDQMIDELDECRASFQTADQALAETCSEAWKNAGITEEMEGEFLEGMKSAVNPNEMK